MSLGELFPAAILSLLTISAAAKEIEKVSFADEVSVGTHKLVLNGAGLRNKRKLGINFRVYVAGLYLTEKSDDAKAIVASDKPKYLRLVFLRSVDKDTIQESVEEAFKKNCKLECDKMASKIKAFNDLLVPLKDGSEMTITFETDGVKVECKGKESTSGKVEGASFAKNLLASYIGDEPPTPELKAALLGK